MTTSAIKERLHEYIDQGDDKLIKLLFALAKEYMDDENHDELSDAELALLEDRRNKRLSGESKTYSWPEAKKMILGNVA
jgi:hypothetical protein